MRFLILAPFGRCRRGTVGSRLLPLARALAARGHETALLIPAWDCPEEVRGQGAGVRGQKSEGGPWGAEAVKVMTPELGVGWRGAYPALLGRLRREVEAFGPDALIVSKGLGYAGWVGRWWMRRDRRVVVDVDDLEVAWMEETGRNRLLARLLTRQERELIRDAMGVTVASRFLQAHWSPWRPRRSQRTSEVLGRADALKRFPSPMPYYLPNGLTPAATRAPVEANLPHALLLTRGHDADAEMLARVWAQVSARVPQAELLIAGGWRPPFPVPNARILGWLPPDRYVQTIRSAAVCLFLPNKKPLVQAKSPARALDCLAQGVPSLTLDVGEYGALVREAGGEPAPNEDTLIARLQLLLTDASARGRLSRAVFAAAPRLSWECRAAGLEAWLSAFCQT